MTGKRATRGTLRCTMIRATLLLLLCYLFTCCTHLALSPFALQCVQAAADTHPPPTAPSPTSTSTSTSTAGPGGTTGAKSCLLGLNEHLKHDNVHKLMSEQDLRRTFQVDSHDQVPEYEILKLTVNHDGSHLISPISDLGELTTTVTNKQQQLLQTTTTTSSARSQPTRVEETRDEHDTTTNTSAIRHKRSSELREDREDKVEVNEASLLQATHKGGHQSRRDRSANAKARGAPETSDERADEGDEERIIVMKLDKFGKNIKLRLKRNADFQQRIKGMKMFIAESTEGGRLKYTEIKSNNRQQPSGHQQEKPPTQQQKHQQHPKEVEEAPAKKASERRQQQKQTESGHIGSSSVNSNVWNIGSTYHDEDNLAALLIDHDRLTGRLQVDGTIGNDFVIKPLPQATFEAVLSKQQHRAASEEPLKSSSSSSPPVRSNRSAAATAPTGNTTSAQLEQAISHMHDDDPHDDDEMFLDEDEALELVHLAGSGNRTQQLTADVSSGGSTTPGSGGWASRAQPLSKAQSERKWRKLRKLMASSSTSTSTTTSKPQHQVPKASASSAAGSQPADNLLLTEEASAPSETKPTGVLLSSHHIVYRQKPSSEGSSSEHQHSMLSGFPSMENIMGQLSRASSQQQQQQHQRPVVVVRGGGAGDSSSQGGSLPHHLNMIDEQDATDFQEDVFGGQFNMEPSVITGTARAGYHDWSLISSPLPPYALNSTSFVQHQQAGGARNATTATTRRLKRDTTSSGGQVRRKRQAPDTVWPEVLLVVDYDSFILHGGDSRDVKRYFVSFWNGVDLRYKLLVHPHIRISLAGMIVAKDRDATPYLERNRLRAPNADAVDAAGALTDMGKYLYREDRLPTYDLAVVITKLDMCRRRYEGGRCNRGTAGFAYVGGACVVNKRLEKVNSVAIIEDSGGFSGIIVAAHEVGHLLGCVHDGSPPPSYLGGPGATLCPWEEGFIMSDLRHTERGFRWSQCSVEQFKHFLNGETATCLYNYPHESQMLHRILPGTMLTLDEQCKRDRGTNACFKDARVCAQLFCFDSASGYCVSYRPAAEGSPCGEGQVCRNGKCVGEIENIIPDYTHQSQVIARRPQSLSALDNGLSASSTSTATSPPDGGPKMAAYVQPVLSSRMDSYSMDGAPIVGNGYQGPYRGGRLQGAARAVSAKLIGTTSGIQGHQNSANIAGATHPTNKHHQHHHHYNNHQQQSMSATSSAPSYAANLGPNYAPPVLSNRIDNSYNLAMDPQTVNSGYQPYQNSVQHSPTYRASRSSGPKLSTTTGGASPHHYTPTRRGDTGNTSKYHTTSKHHHQNQNQHTLAASAAASFK